MKSKIPGAAGLYLYPAGAAIGAAVNSIVARSQQYGTVTRMHDDAANCDIAHSGIAQRPGFTAIP